MIGRAEADAIVRSGRLPSEPKELAIAGDAQLLQRFIRRYCAHSSMVGVRASAAQRRR